MKKKFLANNKAFTILELTIVLLVISLLFGGVFLLGNLNNSGAVQKLIVEVSKIKGAVENFESLYKQLPGDMYNPDNFFTTTTLNGDPSTTRGNGNGVIDGNEGIYAFQHMALAGVLQGNYNGQWVFNRMYQGPAQNSVFYFVSGYGDPMVLRYAKATYSSPSAVITGSTNSVLSVQDIISLEAKFDEGIANSGRVIGASGSDVSSSACSSGANYSTTTGDDNTLRCIVDFRIKQNVFSTTN